MNFDELRRKAESAASTARLAHSLSSLAPSRSSTTARPKTPPQPVKPSLASQRGETTDAYPSRAERFANSTSLQLQSARNAPPPPPRRLAGAGADGERPTRVPPERAAKRAALASAARGVSSAGQAPARLPRSGQSATHVSVGDQSLTRPVPAPPYEAAIASPPTLPTRTRPPPNASGRVAAPNRFDEYDEQDKEAFFEALDEFFASRMTATTSTCAAEPLAPPAALAPTARSASPRPAPRPASPTPSGSPPCAALALLDSLLHPPPTTQPPLSTLFFLPPSPGQTQATSHLPPYLLTRSDHRTSFAWSQHAPNEMTHAATAVFADSSVAWYRISFDPSDPLAARRRAKLEARYRPPARIESWTAEELYAASSVFGARVKAFAAEAVGRGESVGTGECWDLARCALEHVEREMMMGASRGERPFPSTGRAHGALVYRASAARRDEGGRVVGEWVGGDAYVREGDVVEWRSVRIREVGMGEGSWCLLGDPEHTAIVLSPHPPSSPPSLPSSPPYIDPRYPLSALTALTVAEQSLHCPPRQKTYDLATLDEGEVWIWRPVGMRALTGIDGIEVGWDELDQRGVEYRVVR